MSATNYLSSPAAESQTSSPGPLHVIASTSSTESISKSLGETSTTGGTHGCSMEENRESISFQYSWPFRVCERLLENNEAAVLNVSPPFTTSFNGVQFTWALRLSDECVVTQSDAAPSVRHIFVHLYYKDGPSQDVIVEEAKASITCAESEAVLFTDLQLGTKEFTKGSGWPLKVDEARLSIFTEFIQQKIDNQLNVVINLKLKTTLFEPFNYLPDVETSQRIERHCLRFIQNVQESNMIIPEGEHLINHNKFSMHRLVFLHGCDLVERECSEEGQEPCEHFLNLVRSTFARVYFNSILMREVDCLEDFVTLLEGVIDAHIPPLRRELERFICREVLDSTDSEFTKKMLLLAEKFSLDVLKMVATGALVDQIIAHVNPPAKLANITHDLKQFASEMDDRIGPDVSGELIVGSVVEDLQSLTRRVRRVSLSHSPSVSSQGSSPAATPSDVDSLSPSVSDQRPFEQSRFKKVELA